MSKKTRTLRIKTEKKKFKLPRSLRTLFPDVKYAVDAAQAIEVSVNKKDCDTAEPLNPKECALARAAKRELHADGVIIGMASSYVIKGDKAVRFHTPQSVARELVSFDRHHDFATGDYTLIPKSPAARFGSSSHRKNKKGGENKDARRRKIHTSARVRVLAKGSEGAY